MLTVLRVVELTVGVMCSCLPSFVGFFRYCLPPLKSVFLRFSSAFKSARSSNLFNRSSGSSNPESARRVQTGDLKITLGSRVNEKGHFLSRNSWFVSRGGLTQPSHSEFNTTDRPDETRHYNYRGSSETEQALSVSVFSIEASDRIVIQSRVSDGIKLTPVLNNSVLYK